ncbi:MAG TPA: hypothetical protein VGB52_12175 [Actinomycetota bacterium]
MTVTLLWVATFAVGAFATRWLVTRMVARAPLRRRNHRGLELPTAMGAAVVMGIMAGLALIAALRALTGPSSPRLVETATVGLVAMTAMGGFALLGLWDDLAGGGRGWRTHLRSLRNGQPTGGVLKLLGGITLGLIVVAPFGDTIWWTLVDGAIVAMSANLLNLADARPGRACKLYVLAAVPMLIVGGPTAPVLMAGLGAVAAFLPLDLRERAMLGDTGANALGALVGVGVIGAGSDLARALALIALVVSHVLAERPGFTELIERSPLRRADLAGRVP